MRARRWRCRVAVAGWGGGAGPGGVTVPGGGVPAQRHRACVAAPALWGRHRRRDGGAGTSVAVPGCGAGPARGVTVPGVGVPAQRHPAGVGAPALWGRHRRRDGGAGTSVAVRVAVPGWDGGAGLGWRCRAGMAVPGWDGGAGLGWRCRAGVAVPGWDGGAGPGWRCRAGMAVPAPRCDCARGGVPAQRHPAGVAAPALWGRHRHRVAPRAGDRTGVVGSAPAS